MQGKSGGETVRDGQNQSTLFRISVLCSAKHPADRFRASSCATRPTAIEIAILSCWTDRRRTRKSQSNSGPAR
jgi:hypothetical protein